MSRKEDANKQEERSSYRQIFKATSIFGGVQIINIFIGIVRVKFVAVLLGAAGVGIMGLFRAPLDLIISITGLGIAFAAVRDVSESYGKGDYISMAKIIMTLRRWSWLIGLLGAVVTILFAPLLSKWTFGNNDYTWAFVWLSVTLFFNVVSKGQSAILQGTRRIKDLARSGVLGSIMGLMTSIPLYYFYGLKGIVPAIIISAITTLLLSWYYARKVKVVKVSLTTKETLYRGFVMAKLGVSVTLAGFIATLSRYILNAYISNTGGVDQVGLYNAGWGVVAQYTGIVFAAMATDYFPRLSAIHKDNKKIKVLVGQQGGAALLIMSPFLTLLIVTMPIVVRILYTVEFLPIVMFANITVLGMQLKALSWAMGYIYLAKGDSKLFLTLEIIDGVIALLMNIFFYKFYGLIGLGVSFVVSFFIGTIISFFILKRKYQFNLSFEFYRIFFITYALVLSSFLSVFIGEIILKYIVGLIILGLTSYYSLYKLNEFMDIKQLILNKFRK